MKARSGRLDRQVCSECHARHAGSLTLGDAGAPGVPGVCVRVCVRVRACARACKSAPTKSATASVQQRRMLQK
eukprot:7242304-Alexandrium_andersonii.AAC.1